jgi:hypothetical protein
MGNLVFCGLAARLGRDGNDPEQRAGLCGEPSD